MHPAAMSGLRKGWGGAQEENRGANQVPDLH